MGCVAFDVWDVFFFTSAYTRGVLCLLVCVSLVFFLYEVVFPPSTLLCYMRVVSLACGLLRCGFLGCVRFVVFVSFLTSVGGFWRRARVNEVLYSVV